MFTIVSATFTSFFVIIDNKFTFILSPQYAYYTFIKRSFSILKKTLEVIDKSHAITILRYWKAWYGGSMNKISKYHSSIKVKSKNIKSNVVKDYICCLPELQIISCRRQHLKQDFLQNILPLGYKKNPRNTRRTRILVKDFVQDSSLDVEP